MDKKVTIVTHDGTFHADDVFAVAALLMFLEKAPVVATVIRTRDESEMRKADFVVDVGGLSDAERNRFDHHQQGGAGVRPNGIPFASFGLVWRKIGRELSGSVDAAAAVDKKLIAPVDANDGGVNVYKKVFSDVSPYALPDYIQSLRPSWQESPDTLEARFFEAVAFARSVLEREIVEARAVSAARALVRAAYEHASDKRIVALDAFYPAEETLAAFPEPLFFVSPRPDKTWHAKAVRDDKSSFKNRKDFPAAWAGKRDRELAQITGVADAVFCHNNRFMAVARSRQGAVELAKLAVEETTITKQQAPNNDQ